jgi:uncharacterized delta-60 repeat protein
LDTTFAGGGIVTTTVGFDLVAKAVAIQGDGKIVAAGYMATRICEEAKHPCAFDFALARYSSSGDLDTTFSGDGTVTTPIGSSDDFASGLAIQADSKIVAAGDSRNGGQRRLRPGRYSSKGALDTTFDGDGKLTTHGFVQRLRQRGGHAGRRQDRGRRVQLERHRYRLRAGQVPAVSAL